MRFARATALTPTDGGFAGTVAPTWDIGGIANGGYLMAVLGRAALLAADRPDVVSLSAEFLAPGRVGPLTATTRSLKAGRRFDTVRVELRDGDGPFLTGTVHAGDLAANEDETSLPHEGPGDMPPPDECLRAVPGDFLPPPIVGNVDLRMHPNDAPWSPDADEELQVRAWFRLLDDEPIDTTAAVMACDITAPTILKSALPPGWMPTVQMTVHVRRRPRTSWLRIDTHTRFVTNGMLEIDCLLWDDDDALVAQSRQLALVPRGS